MSKTVNANLTADWSKPAMVLLLVQIIMIFALLAFVRSPWYGEFFNLRIRGMLVGGYRDSSNINGLKRALVYSKSSNRSKYEDLEIIDEIALHSPLKNTGEWTKRLSAFANDKNAPQLVQDIAVEKQLRNELRIAKLEIANNDIDKAEESKNRAAHLLSLPYRSSNPRLVQVKKFLSLAAAIAQLKGDTDQSLEIRKELALIDNPMSAQSIYSKYKISGFDNDFTSTYKIQYLMKCIEKAPNPQIQMKYLKEAVEICKEKTLPYPFKIAILLNTQLHASENKDDSILSEVFDLWCKDCSDRVPSSREEAYLISGLQSVANKEQNPDKSTRLLRRLLNCVEQKRFPEAQITVILQQYTGISSQMGLFIPGEAISEDLLKLNDYALNLAKKNGIDNESILLARIPILTALKQVDKSQELLFELLRKNAKSQAYISAMRNVVPVIEQINNCLFDHHSSREANDFMQKVIDLHKWDDAGQLAEILVMKVNDEEGAAVSSSTSLKSLKQVVASGRLDENKNFIAQELILRIEAFNANFDEAGKLYRQLKKQYANNKSLFAKLCLLETSKIRALPSYSPKLKSGCLSNSYPGELFEDVLSSSTEFYGKNSEQCSLALLWCAQYEFCKGDNRAAQLDLERIIDNWTPNLTCCYLPAEYLLGVIKSSPIDITKYKQCAPGTLNELRCQQSLLESSGHIDESKRCKNFAAQLVENK